MGDPVALESRPLGRTIGDTAPEPKHGTLPRQAAANQVEVFLAGRLEAQPSRASPAPMGAPASCATVPRTTAGTHPRAPAKMPKEAPDRGGALSQGPALPSSPTHAVTRPRDRRPSPRPGSRQSNESKSFSLGTTSR